MKLIALSRGLFAKVDDGDFEVLSKWKWHSVWNHTNNVFYAGRNERGVDGKQHTIRMHRFLMGAESGVQVDHRNRDTLDNQRGNLRLATNEQNQHNRGMHRTNTSGYTGVGFRKDYSRRPWTAQIRVKTKTVHLGCFKTAEEAASAYRTAELEYRGEFAR